MKGLGIIYGMQYRPIYNLAYVCRALFLLGHGLSVDYEQKKYYDGGGKKYIPHETAAVPRTVPAAGKGWCAPQKNTTTGGNK
jgi:hypothetical protein